MLKEELSEASLVVKSVNLVNVATGEVYETSIAIDHGLVVDVGHVNDLVGTSTRVIDAHGLYAAPGFIDSHVHLESSHLTLSGFAEAALPHGTTSAVFDPHEIANVAGVVGIEALMMEAEALPFGSYFTVPSCVPSAPGLETSGAELGTSEVEDLLTRPSVVGLAEVMDYLGVLQRRPALLSKIKAALKLLKRVDGHCPGLRGRRLASYVGAGPSSDHECIGAEEALEKLRLGLWVMIREGSAAKELDEVLQVVLRKGLDTSRLLLVTDDLDPRDLVSGYFDVRLRRAVELGIDPAEAIRLVTLNPSTYFRLDYKAGLIAPGWRADLVILRDLRSFEVVHVVLAGELAVSNGFLLRPLPQVSYPEPLYHSVRAPKLSPFDFAIRTSIEEGEAEARAIEVYNGSLVTKERRVKLKVVNGLVQPSPDTDVIQLAVIERHGRSGGVGKGFLLGLGLRRGAVASTYAHDAHNIVVAGASWSDMAKAVKRLKELQGGFVVIVEGRVEAELELRIAGLLSPGQPKHVAEALKKVEEALRRLGCRLSRPLQTLSFISLPVIPKLRLTDKGLVDVEEGCIVNPVLG
ncbi:MAG: adenine deaminase [Candidatus Nezhaarchaeota archaeon]|nr:adenine deaminase [Candidatus Nezhaarchaeota archaeon]